MNKGMYTDILRRFGMRFEEEAPKNGEPTIGFSFTTMFQHTYRIWLKLM
jgi:hypothetical protein